MRIYLIGHLIYRCIRLSYNVLLFCDRMKVRYNRNILILNKFLIFHIIYFKDYYCNNLLCRYIVEYKRKNESNKRQSSKYQFYFYFLLQKRSKLDDWCLMYLIFYYICRNTFSFCNYING